ncbi:MAG: twin-arginine translocase TatA/TatE family subunit [Flavobacteriales bacterium]|nr:twin-arginine translocase TatA/TatE family subunit [Flavobacteriales bacterium]|tara:strand:- start:9949 stop:10149 length:201 start_codon:yes stop_codon:yes gene_type:complete
MESTLLFIQRMGPWGIVLIVLVVLLLFGGKKIPELMKGLGKGVKEFKNATNELKEEVKDDGNNKQS